MKLTLDDTEFYDEFRIWALVSDLPVTRLCYLLNQDCDLQLSRASEDLCLHQKNHHFPHFRYTQTSSELNWFLTANTSYFNGEKSPASQNSLFDETALRNYNLLPALKRYNFLFTLSGDIRPADTIKINNTLKGLSYLKTFKLIDLSVTSKIENLITQL